MVIDFNDLEKRKAGGRRRMNWIVYLILVRYGHWDHASRV